MNSSTVRFAIIAALLLPVSFGASAGDLYKVSATLSQDGKAFASPVLVVDEGVPASIEVGGKDGYKLSLTVTRAQRDRLKIACDLDSSHGSMSPVLLVQAGQPASVSVGPTGLSLIVERVRG